MKNKISDKDILQLFTSMKNAENNYPRDMIESRRDTFTKQAAAMAILMKASGSGAASTGAGQAASTAASSTSGIGGISMGTILETALVIAIVAEAGVAAYAYREKITEFINSKFRANVNQVENPPNDSSPNPILSNEATPEFLQELPTITVTVTETPTPTSSSIPASDNNQSNDSSEIGNSQVTSTPAPTDDNNGLHLGQTKQPTKQPKNNNSNNSKDAEDKGKKK